ncbi:hypothetical protein FHT44_006187 [Mycolicibacterium sp. BK634]|uniref:hypothetical protein n=1 Tax=Mycolicibacterium sp. BK634 TaxID=2587099 RepID=UPI001618DCF6|nr:hypothetical protein [Mycolicibacterium sp. BK634]MBB3753665.1 hypothetical protein [Mycolicibacterium sp. BK634]
MIDFPEARDRRGFRIRSQGPIRGHWIPSTPPAEFGVRRLRVQKSDADRILSRTTLGSDLSQTIYMTMSVGSLGAVFVGRVEQVWASLGTDVVGSVARWRIWSAKRCAAWFPQVVYMDARPGELDGTSAGVGQRRSKDGLYDAVQAVIKESFFSADYLAVKTCDGAGLIDESRGVTMQLDTRTIVHSAIVASSSARAVRKNVE